MSDNNHAYFTDEGDPPVYTEKEMAEAQAQIEQLLAEREQWRTARAILEQGMREYKEKLARREREAA